MGEHGDGIREPDLGDDLDNDSGVSDKSCMNMKVI
jgi:hypothetical protein